MTRRGWYLEELSRAPSGTRIGEKRSQVSLVALNWDDSIAAKGSVLASLRYFEILLEAGQIQAGITGSAAGTQVRRELHTEQTFFAVEAARYFVDDRNYYGRIGIKLVDFLPANLWAWRAGLQTGTRPTPESPWDVEFGLNGFIYFNHLSDYVFASLGTGHTYYFAKDTQSLRIGATASFGQKSMRVPVGESLLLNIAPIVQYTHPDLGDFHLSIPIRIWIDRETSTNGQPAYMSDFNAPAARLSWRMIL